MKIGKKAYNWNLYIPIIGLLSKGDEKMIIDSTGLTLISGNEGRRERLSRKWLAR